MVRVRLRLRSGDLADRGPEPGRAGRRSSVWSFVAREFASLSPPCATSLRLRYEPRRELLYGAAAPGPGAPKKKDFITARPAKSTRPSLPLVKQLHRIRRLACTLRREYGLGVLDRIRVVPGLCDGRATIRGLRFTVDFVLKLLGDGYTADEIVREYPELEREDVLQAARFGAWLASERTSAVA